MKSRAATKQACGRSASCSPPNPWQQSRFRSRATGASLTAAGGAEAARCSRRYHSVSILPEISDKDDYVPCPATELSRVSTLGACFVPHSRPSWEVSQVHPPALRPCDRSPPDWRLPIRGVGRYSRPNKVYFQRTDGRRPLWKTAR